VIGAKLNFETRFCKASSLVFGFKIYKNADLFMGIKNVEFYAVQNSQEKMFLPKK
jgi:hypothetical protein